MGWLAAGSGYQVTLQRGKVVCRTEQGKVLKNVPKSLAEDEAVVGLRQLVEWLDRHAATCRSEVDRFMIRSLPVPATVLARVWPDEAWRAALTDLVVVPVTVAGEWVLDEAGFLRDADPSEGIGVVNLDGESVRFTSEQVAIPHPVRLPDLDDLREFAADLGVAQGTLQLFREIWPKPVDPAEQEAQLHSYAGGRYAELRHLTGRAAKLGYPVRGGYVTNRIWEDGRVLAAAVWAGAEDPSVETETGPLTYLDPDGRAVPADQVGRIAWSEGMRMAAGLYAGRVVEQEVGA